jgi:GAF domain-containing protein
VHRLAAAATTATAADELCAELRALCASALSADAVHVDEAVPGRDGAEGSALFVPIAFGGEVRRVVTVVSHAPREFTAGERELAETLAAIAGAGLARLDAERRPTAHRGQDRALVRAARALNRSLDLQEVHHVSVQFEQ